MKLVRKSSNRGAVSVYVIGAAALIFLILLSWMVYTLFLKPSPEPVWDGGGRPDYPGGGGPGGGTPFPDGDEDDGHLYLWWWDDGHGCAYNWNCASNCCSNDFCVPISFCGTNGGVIGDPCVQNNDCASGCCKTNTCVSSSRCTDGEDGDPCAYNWNCASKCCSNDVCTSPRFCGTDSGEPGDPCTQNNNCASGCCKSDICVSSSRCADGGEDGDSCIFNDQCISKCCSNNVCTSPRFCGTDSGEPGDPCTQNNNCASGCCKSDVCVSSSRCDEDEDGTENWQTFRGYGFEIKYPRDWNLNSCPITDPANPGNKVYIYKGTNIKTASHAVTIGISTQYPFSPDPAAVTGRPSQKKIDGYDAREQVWSRGYCEGASCSNPFIILWTRYVEYNIYSLVFDNTTAIYGIYDQILSTFKFTE